MYKTNVGIFRCDINCIIGTEIRATLMPEMGIRVIAGRTKVRAQGM